MRRSLMLEDSDYNKHTHPCMHTQAHPLLTYVHTQPPPQDLTYPFSISVLAKSASVCVCVCVCVFARVHV